MVAVFFAITWQKQKKYKTVCKKINNLLGLQFIIQITQHLFFGQIQRLLYTPVYLSIKDNFYTRGTFTPIGIKIGLKE